VTANLEPQATGRPSDWLAVRRTGAAGAALLIFAGWVVWRPVEIFPATAIVAATVVLALTVWGWRRTPATAAGAWLTAAGAFCILLASGLTGWDPAASITEVALAAGVAAFIWLASREAPPERWPAFLALIISGLALWGMWQVGGGLDQAASALDQLPGLVRNAAAERLASGRAFASLPLPSHLAVLLATALPLLLVRLRMSWVAAPWAVGSALCVIGLALTRSPIGAALGLAACVVLAASRGRGRLVWVALVLAIVLAIVVVGRGDVMKLEPVQLRSRASGTVRGREQTAARALAASRAPCRARSCRFPVVFRCCHCSVAAGPRRMAEAARSRGCSDGDPTPQPGRFFLF